MPKMPLSTEQRVSIVKTYDKETFRRRFPEKHPPTNRRIWKNAKKYECQGTSLNINKGNSCRRETVRIEKAIKIVKFYV